MKYVQFEITHINPIRFEPLYEYEITHMGGGLLTKYRFYVNIKPKEFQRRINITIPDEFYKNATLGKPYRSKICN